MFSTMSLDYYLYHRLSYHGWFQVSKTPQQIKMRSIVLLTDAHSMKSRDSSKYHWLQIKPRLTWRESKHSVKDWVNVI